MSEAGRAKKSPYHVVCHDCTYEELVDDEETAREYAETHGRVGGHRVRWTAFEDDPGQQVDAGETIQACPVCDSSDLRKNNIRSAFSTATTEYHCNACSHLFDQPTMRERRASGSRQGLAKRLVDANPDDLRADGGLVAACPECDASGIELNCAGGVRSRNPDSARYVCKSCRHRFDECRMRKPKGNRPVNGLAAKLDRADPDDLRADGGREFAVPGDDVWTRFQESEIGIGDVVVDLARGKPLQVVSVSAQSAGEHEYVRSDRTAAMFDTDADDLVFNCVFLPDGEGAISAPSKTYAYPESRLLRYPVEQATSNHRLQREWLSNVLETLAVAAAKKSRSERRAFFIVVREAFGENVAELTEEFAEAAGGDSE